MARGAVKKPVDRSVSKTVMQEIVMGSRVRLARNIDGALFPERAEAEQRQKIFDQVSAALQSECAGIKVVPSTKESAARLKLLYEKHLISYDLLEPRRGCGVAYTPDHTLSVMINEEDHLRLQAFTPGLDFMNAWHCVDDLDTRLEQHLYYAWSLQHGYLTACPSNLGAGMRVSVMMHLLGLHLTNEIEAVLDALESMRFLVRGVAGEDSGATGQIYQISNVDSLGQAEEVIFERVARICHEVVRQEHNARLRLWQRADLGLQDCVARALSTLQHARLMSSVEALEHLSGLRLGCALKMIRGVTMAKIARLMREIQPGHLQARSKCQLSGLERAEQRALWLSQALSKATYKG